MMYNHKLHMRHYLFVVSLYSGNTASDFSACFQLYKYVLDIITWVALIISYREKSSVKTVFPRSAARVQNTAARAVRCAKHQCLTVFFNRFCGFPIQHLWLAAIQLTLMRQYNPRTTEKTQWQQQIYLAKIRLGSKHSVSIERPHSVCHLY